MNPIAVSAAIKKTFALARRGYRYGLDGELIRDAQLMQKFQGETTVEKNETEKVSWADTLLGPVAKSGGRPEIVRANDGWLERDSDEDEDDEKAKAAVEGEDDLDLDNDDRKARGVAAKRTKGAFATSFSSVVFPLETQEPARQPRVADEGVDRTGRSYDSVNEIGARLGRFNSNPTDMSPIPNAGAGGTVETTTEGLRYDPQTFAESRDDAMIGGDEKGFTRSTPNQGKDGAYSLESEGGLPGRSVVRSGPNFLLPGVRGEMGSSEPLVFPEAKVEPVLKRAGARPSFRDVFHGGPGSPTSGQDLK